MKTVELPGIKIEDVGSVWYDLLKKDFDVEAVGVNDQGTFVYVADDEEKDPIPVVSEWVGKAPADMSRSAVEKMRKQIKELKEEARKKREERAAARKQEEDKVAVLISSEKVAASSNTPDLGDKPVSFQDGQGNVIGELMEGVPGGPPKENWLKRAWKALF
jgi:hypothetical protein